MLPCLPQRRQQGAAAVPRAPLPFDEQVTVVATALVSLLDGWLAAARDWPRVAQASQALWLLARASLPACRLVCSSGGAAASLRVLQNLLPVLDDGARASASSGAATPAQAAAAQLAACRAAADAATGVLLECAAASERTADDLMESECCRLLLATLVAPRAGPTAKQHISALLHRLCAAKLLYRDILQGAGGNHVLASTCFLTAGVHFKTPHALRGALQDATCAASLCRLTALQLPWAVTTRCSAINHLCAQLSNMPWPTSCAGVLQAVGRLLSDAASLCDLTTLQQLLWVLTALADDEDCLAAYRDAMREAGLLQAVAQLLNVMLLPANAGLFR